MTLEELKVNFIQDQTYHHQQRYMSLKQKIVLIHGWNVSILVQMIMRMN